MSKKTKIISAILIVIIIAVCLFWYSLSRSASGNRNQSKRGLPTNTISAAVMSSPSNTSDAGLQQDTSAIDFQMNGLNADVRNANQ